MNKKMVRFFSFIMAMVITIVFSNVGVAYAGTVSDQNEKAESLDNSIAFTKTMLGTSRFSSIASNGSMFVAVNLDGDIYSSEDAIFWDKTKTGVEDINNVTWGGGLFVAVAEHGKILTSANGYDWTLMDLRKDDSYSSIYSICYSGDLYVAGGYSSIYSSEDGIHWSKIIIDSLIDIYSITFNGMMYVAVGNGKSVLISKDAKNWTVVNTNISSIYTLCSVIWDGDKFIAVGKCYEDYSYKGIVITSQNGVKWSLEYKAELSSSEFQDIIFTGSKYYTVGNSYDYYGYDDRNYYSIHSSYDLKSWSDVNVKGAYLYDIATNGSQLVAVGSYGTVLVSDAQLITDNYTTPSQDNKSVTDIKLDSTTISLKIDEEETIISTITPADATNQKVIWQSSKPSIASVEDNGDGSATIKAHKEGTSTITVKTEDGNKTASCNVTVEPDVIKVTKVVLDQKKLSMNEGDEDLLIATVLPDDATNQEVMWSSDNKGIVEVDEEGNLYAKKEGKARITVTTKDGRKTAYCDVTVIGPIKVTGIVLDAKTLKMEVGSEEQLTATIKPGNATNQDVIWSSSNKGIVEVDEEGNIYAKKVGKAKITATTVDGKKKAYCNVTVLAPVKVTGVTLDARTLTMAVGSEEWLTATIKPADATNQDVIWSSSNKGIVEVDEEGNLYAKKAGKAKITVTTVDGKKKAYCNVTVLPPIKVTGVTLDARTLTMEIGSEEQLTATIKPVDATNQDLIWSSSNNGIVEVDEEGNLYAKKAGKAKITVTTVDGKKKAYCDVTVTGPIEVTGVVLDTDILNMTIGDEKQLTVTVEPSDASNQNVTWSSSNTGIVIVDEEGNVTAMKAGTAIITVSTANGKYKATCNITVEKPGKKTVAV